MKRTSDSIVSITRDHKAYPPLLTHIPDPPPVLYVRGNIDALKEVNCFGVVGTRAFTEYGARTARDLTAGLSRSGFTVVSGLALGIDSIAHATALEEKRPTIAVLGSGLSDEVLYPHRNLRLAYRILESGGALISEYGPDVRAQLFTFPFRNRIISGMSKGVLVVEGDIKSGTMITAKRALDQGRDVFAVPGPIYAKKSEGTNYLIQKGAKLVARIEDILEEYGIYLPPANTIAPDGPVETAIFKTLGNESLSTDEIIRKSGLETGTITASLIVMELNKKVRSLGNGKYVVYS